METTTGHSSVKSTSIQVAVTLLASSGMLNRGLALGFPSLVVPPLLSHGPGLHATVNQASLISGIYLISASVACLLTGPLIDWLGRRSSLLLLNLTYASGWLVMAVFPQTLYSLYVGRIVTGLGVGLTSCAVLTYTTEVVDMSLRTTLVTLPSVMMAFGTFLIYLWAVFYQHSWTEASYFGFGITMLSLILTPLLPESPLWLLENGHTDKALQALVKLRGASSPDQVKEELETFTSKVKSKKDEKTCSKTFRNLWRPQVYKPLSIMSFFFLFQQMSGVTIMVAFAVNFTSDAGIKAQAYYVALGISSVRLFSAFLTSWACSKFGRRAPALLSGTVMSISMLVLAYSTLLKLSPWSIGALIFVNVLSSSVGFSTLPMSIVGELFPTNVRGFASGITACIASMETFAALTIYQGMVLSFGSNHVFIFFGISGLVGTLFLYIFLPETHGKSLLEIEEYFKGSKKQLEAID